jgi:hypothetical protein
LAHSGHSHNEIVGFYLSAVCSFYGITLGLLAVGTWQAYSDVDSKVDEEASVLAALYRNVSTFPDPKRAELQADLREYARQVIDVAWPLQQRGIVPQNTAAIVQAFQTHLASFEPVTESQKTLHAEAYREFDRLVELRRIRLNSVVAGLPAPLWSVVLVGAFLNIAVTWFFDMFDGRTDTPLEADEATNLYNSVQRYWSVIDEGWPMPTIAGGVVAQELHAFYELLGPDVAYFLGGAVACHGDGPKEGARLCRQIIDAAIKGRTNNDGQPLKDGLILAMKNAYGESHPMEYIEPRALIENASCDLKSWFER